MDVSSEFYKQGDLWFDRGNTQVRANNLQEACMSYQSGIQAIVHGLKDDKHKWRKEYYEKRGNEFYEAALKLKEHMGLARPAGSGSGGGGSGSSGGAAGSARSATVPVAASVADLVTRCNVPWDKVAGLESVKAALREVVIAPLQFPSWFEGEVPDERPWNGILLYGPPGTGKSLLAKAVCTELGTQVAKRFPGKEAAFFSIKVSDVLKPYLGQSEQRMMEIFAEARKVTPCGESTPLCTFLFLSLFFFYFFFTKHDLFPL